MDLVTPFEVDRFQGIVMPFSWKAVMSAIQANPMQNRILPSALHVQKKLTSTRHNYISTPYLRYYAIMNTVTMPLFQVIRIQNDDNSVSLLFYVIMYTHLSLAVSG